MKPLETNVAICEALGLDANRISALSIDLHHSRPPSVVATYIVEDDQMATIVEVLRRSKLIPVAESDSPED